MPRCATIFVLVLTLIAGVFRASAYIDAALQMELGNPSNASSDTNNHDHYLIQRTVEAMDYNDNNGLPNWASWNLTTNDLGTSGRSNFSVDTNLPPNFFWVGTGAYSGSGYDRGHLCPSADRTITTNDNDMVFLMSNMMPQTGENNSGVWNQFEGYCRSLATSTNNYELLIICGPSGFSGARINTNGYVWIPQYTWKIVVVVPPGAGLATNRITTTNRVITIKVPNTDAATNNWQSYVTSANQIQVDTGFTFFTALPPSVAAVLRSKVDGQTNAPPDIFAFSPTNGSVGTNVVIAGTNFSSASQVAFNGVSAAFTIDTPTQITATVPTNAGSGFVSVTTPSGTAISTNSFTVLNNGGTVYSGLLAGWDTSAVTDYGPSPFPATSNAPNVAVVGLTRSAGVKTSGSGAAGGWGGTGFTNTSVASTIASNIYVTFSLTVSNGYRLSFTGVSRFDYRRSTTSPTNGVLQFQVGASPFVDVTNLNYASDSTSGDSLGMMDLSQFGTLQNIGAGTNVTFRIVNYGGTNAAGTWYVYDKAGTPAMDLAVQGTVIQIVSTNVPAMTSLAFANNQFQFTVTGTAGALYVVQATTNLNNPGWLNVATNPAPFVFTQTNVSAVGQRFYRVATP